MVWVFFLLGDFGIATALDAGQKQANSVVGTPYYMAPELLNQQPYTDAVDMFALGCTVRVSCRVVQSTQLCVFEK